MYARARELARNPECGVTLPGSGEPTYRNIGRTVSYYDVVAPTAGHEDNPEQNHGPPSAGWSVKRGDRYNNQNATASQFHLTSF